MKEWPEYWICFLITDNINMRDHVMFLRFLDSLRGRVITLFSNSHLLLSGKRLFCPSIAIITTVTLPHHKCNNLLVPV